MKTARHRSRLPLTSPSPSTRQMAPPTEGAQQAPSPFVASQEISGLPSTSQSPSSSPVETLFQPNGVERSGREMTLSSLTYKSLTIPKSHKARTLVLCFDGTGDQFDADNSNIVNFFSALSKGDPDNQMAGIGTYIGRGGNPILTRISKTLDEAVAWNLKTHIMDGYEFLMQNYRANDRICIFGFSRGAYTARCLAGMLHKVGLLPACNHQQVPFAYKMYTRPDEYGWKQSNAFKKAFSVDVDIEFLGVWDTVNSVGILPKRLPFSASNNLVRSFRHAISLDERRAKFKANVWNRPVHGEDLLSVTDQEAAKRKKKAEKEQDKKDKHKGHLHHYEAEYSESTIRHETDVEEVWFAGCHCDVGGGSVSNGTSHSLARIPLRWMIRECFKCNTGIMFQADMLRKMGMDIESLFPIVLPRPPALSPEGGAFIERIPKDQPSILAEFNDEDSENDVYLMMSEEEHEMRDALSPKYDQLAIKKTWWLGEVMPMRHRYQRSNNEWVKQWGLNLGKGRVIPRQGTHGVKIHRTVKTRLEGAFENGKKYLPKAANLDMTKVTWVD